MRPVVLGSGKRLFDGGPAADLELTEARKVGPTVQLMIFRPVRATAESAGAQTSLKRRAAPG